MKDPIYHGFSTDKLPDDHPLAWSFLYCTECGAAVHGANNDTGYDWFETGLGPVCFDCYAKAVSAFDTAKYALEGK